MMSQLHALLSPQAVAAIEGRDLIIPGIVAVVIVLLLMAGANRKKRAAEAEAEARAAKEGPRPMGADRFWAIVEGAKEASGPDPLHRADHLTRALRELESKEIAAFNSRYGERKADAHFEDLRTAAHLMLGGCDETSFSHFRDWLISEGKEVYEAAVKEPDSMAALGKVDVLRLESFGYAAKRAYKAQASAAMPGYAVVPDKTTRAPDWDAAAARVRLPKLAAIYG